MGTELRTTIHPSAVGAENGGCRFEEENHGGHLRETDATDCCSR